MKKLQRLELLKDFIQEAVDRGANSVQAVHQYIADLPFEALEQTGLIDEDKAGLREKHRQTIGVVYDAIRRINREIGQLISDQFENIEESAIAAKRMAPPPAPRATPAVDSTAAPAAIASPKPVQKAAPKSSGPAALGARVASKQAAVKKAVAKKAVAKKAVAKKAAAKKKPTARG